MGLGASDLRIGKNLDCFRWPDNLEATAAILALCLGLRDLDG